LRLWKCIFSSALTTYSSKVFSGMIRKASEEKFSYVVIQKIAKSKQLSSPREKTVKKPIGIGRGGASSLHSLNEPAERCDPWTSPVAVDATPARPASSGPPTGPAAEKDPSPLTVLNRFAEVEADELPQLLDALIDEVSTCKYYSFSRFVLNYSSQQVDWPAYNPVLHREEWSRIIRCSSHSFIRIYCTYPIGG
jgi:hypothetical protein